MGDNRAAELDVSSSRWRRRVTVEQVVNGRLATAKRAFTTRRVPLEAMQTLISGRVRPRPGDLVVAQIERLGQHQKLELTSGRRARLHHGDEIIVAYANRYATDQFESQVPMDLGPTQLVASGGVASSVLTRSHDVRAATNIIPVALVGDRRGHPLNVAGFGLDTIPTPTARPTTISVIGTSMNSGKTTTIHRLVRGLALAGHAPGVCKVTGTGSGNDYWIMEDAGAHRMLDFTDVGMASTYLADVALLERTTVQLIDHLTHAGCRTVLVEVADGLLQRETSRLVDSTAFRSRIDGVVFAAADAMGAIGGVERLRALGLNVVAVAGRLTASPLATREATEALDVPVLTLDELSDPAIASELFGLDSAQAVTLARPDARRASIGSITTAPAASEDDDRVTPGPPTVAVIGTATGSATSTIHDLVRGLVLSGRAPGVCKVTGTAAGNEYWLTDDTASVRSPHFPIAVEPSHLVDVSQLERTTVDLLDRVGDSCEAVLVEVAGGLLLVETTWLMNSAQFRRRIDGVIFVAADAIGAIGGVERLRSLGLVVVGVTGALAESPLARRAAREALGVPVLTAAELSDPHVAARLLGLHPLVVDDRALLTAPAYAETDDSALDATIGIA